MGLVDHVFFLVQLALDDRCAPPLIARLVSSSVCRKKRYRLEQSQRYPAAAAALE